MLALFYALCVLALLASELREHQLGQRIFKPLAAFGFILLALSFGALESDYGLLVLTGLLACAAGDVFLLSRKSETLFKMGMGAFALGHIFYILAASLISRHDMPFFLWVGSSFIGLTLGWVVFQNLKKHLSKAFLWPVAAYVFIISVMLIKAVQVNPDGYKLLIIPAALCFALSDVFVSRDRFVHPSPKNSWIITPFYFGAQALFAMSIS